MMAEAMTDDELAQWMPECDDCDNPPECHPTDVSRESLENQFGKLTMKNERKTEQRRTETNSNTNSTTSQNDDVDKTENKEADDRGSIHTPLLHVMSSPILQSEFSIADKLSNRLCGLRCHGSDRVCIAGADNKIYLVDMIGSVIHVINTGCEIYPYTGLCVTNEDELIFSDVAGKKVMTISHDHIITTLFSTEIYEPCGVTQCSSGDLMVCLPYEKVIRVYNVAGKAIKDIGKGHLQCPLYVTVNRTNDDVCVSDNSNKIVVFHSSGEKRFTYTGDGTIFDPMDICCDQLGNILITDCYKHHVHIIDRDGHFLRYLVSGEQNISYPITIDIDSNGHVVVGEYFSRKVKSFLYLQ